MNSLCAEFAGSFCDADGREQQPDDSDSDADPLQLKSDAAGAGLLAEWLRTIKMEAYLRVFTDNGYGDLHLLIRLETAEVDMLLMASGIPLQHQEHLRKNLVEAKLIAAAGLPEPVFVDPADQLLEGREGEHAGGDPGRLLVVRVAAVNPNGRPVAFKVKASNRVLWNVSPKEGILPANAATFITLTYKPPARYVPAQQSMHKFLLSTVFARPEASGGGGALETATDAWSPSKALFNSSFSLKAGRPGSVSPELRRALLPSRDSKFRVRLAILSMAKA
eukprot:SAG22_NODE_4303_length_1311_cov_2.191419_1_plen_277_part_01